MEGHLTNWFDFKEDFNCQSNYVDKKKKQIHNQSVPHWSSSLLTSNSGADKIIIPQSIKHSPRLQLFLQGCSRKDIKKMDIYCGGRFMDVCRLKGQKYSRCPWGSIYLHFLFVSCHHKHAEPWDRLATEGEYHTKVAVVLSKDGKKKLHLTQIHQNDAIRTWKNFGLSKKSQGVQLRS